MGRRALFFILLGLVFLLGVVRTYEFDRFGKNKPKPKKAPQLPKKPVVLNTDLLPDIKQLLEEQGLTSYFPQLIKMGVTETHFLLRLTAMDYRIMLMDWEGITEEQVNRLKEKAAALYQLALVKEEAEAPSFDERNKLKYGRVYVPGAVQNFEYVTASFGGPPPLGMLEVVLAPAPHYGCNETDFTILEREAYSGKLLVVKRGECSFLSKALMAKVYLNATALLVVNSEDRLDSPAAGLGIDPNVTEKMVEPVLAFPVISVANTSWAKLAFSAEVASTTAPVTAHIVPLKCGPGGICKATVESEKELVPEVSWGTARFKSEKSKEVRSFEFLTSNYGGRLPEDHESLPVILGDPLDGCAPIQSTAATTGRPFVLALARGGCRFSTKQQHAQDVGARLTLIFEKESQDSALQRIGGVMPEAGFIGIPSIIVAAPAGVFLQSKLLGPSGKDESVSVSLLAASDNSAAERWIELAFTEWAESDDERLMQIEGLSQKHAQARNVEIVNWLQRASVAITATTKIATDAEL